MKCKFCDSPEELEWPENWTKGVRPINKETGQVHECIKEDNKPKDNVIKYYCGDCDNVETYCEDLNCVLCKTLPGFCSVCNTHPQVTNVK